MKPLLYGIGYDDPIKRYRGERVLKTLAKLQDGRTARSRYSLETAIDVFYTFYLPFPVINRNVDLGEKDAYARYLIVSSMLSAKWYHELKMYTIIDTVSSTVAAAVFLRNLHKELQKHGFMPGRDFVGSHGSGMRQKSGNGEHGKTGEELIRKHVSDSLRKTVRTVTTAKELVNAIKSFAAGSTSLLTLEEAIPDIARLSENADVREILEYLKGMDVGGLKFTRDMSRWFKGETTGLEHGVDLERIHPHELALPRDVFYADFANHKLLLYQKSLPLRKGPVYVLVDKSGSMVGEKMMWAKALTISLLKKSLREGRTFYMRFFDSRLYPVYKATPRARGSSLVRLIDMLSRVKPQGGTDITRAIKSAAKDVAREKKRRDGPGDLIMVTDGEDTLDAGLVRGILQRSGLRLVVVMVKGENESLKKAADVYLKTTSLGRREIKVVLKYLHGKPVQRYHT